MKFELDPKYYLTQDVFNKSSATLDVFKNQFDKTWLYSSQNKDKNIFTILPGENIKDDGSVTYQYNKDGFRSDEFKINNSKYTVVFGGCSETEGVGGNLDEVWSYKLYKELKNKYNIENYYSLGKAGYGWHKIILNFLIYAEKYGNPTHFFVLLPNIGRNYFWDENLNAWNYNQKYTNFYLNKTVHNKNILFDCIKHKDYFIEFSVGWKIFEKYCNSHNIKLLFSTWEYEENNNLMFANQHKDFFPLSNDGMKKYLDKNYDNLKIDKKDLQKRDGHKGNIVHEYYKSEFLNEIESRGLFND